MKLGRLIQLLRASPATLLVRYGFRGLSPTTLRSYRGYYEQLALGCSDTDDCKVTVEQLQAECEAALGKVFTGYKGGDYTMGAETEVWIDNYGDCSGTTLVGVREYPTVLILETGYED